MVVPVVIICLTHACSCWYLCLVERILSVAAHSSSEGAWRGSKVPVWGNTGRATVGLRREIKSKDHLVEREKGEQIMLKVRMLSGGGVYPPK